jgi:carbonic anhydrase/acetyltransferase-like protein (isoleucine patch superfamily)
MGDNNDNKNDDNNNDDTDDTYIKTTTHNYVSRRAIIDGAKQVEIRGRSIIHEKVKVRGDLSIIKIGRYVEIGSSTLLEPSQNPYNQDNDNKKYIPMIIGSHSHIGKECTIQAAAIGSSKYLLITLYDFLDCII